MSNSVRISRGGRCISFKGKAARLAFEAITGTKIVLDPVAPVLPKSKPVTDQKGGR